MTATRVATSSCHRSNSTNITCAHDQYALAHDVYTAHQTQTVFRNHTLHNTTAVTTTTTAAAATVAAAS